jgi:hypothetical protein
VIGEKGFIALLVVFLFGIVSCAPTENITAIKEVAYKDGFMIGYDKGYLKGTIDGQIGLVDIKQGSYKDGYSDGSKDAIADSKQSAQDNQPAFVTTIPIAKCSFPGKYVGDKSTKIYHLPTCTLAQQMAPENQIWTYSVVAFSFYGIRPCDICKPPK